MARAVVSTGGTPGSSASSSALIPTFGLRCPLRLSNECGAENIPDRISLYPVQQIPEQMRHLGACGGRAHGRNQRARRALVATPPEAVPPPALPQQTTAEAIHLLDTQFPWLRGAER